MTPHRIPSFSKLPWTQNDYDNIKSPEFWSNQDVFQPWDTLAWSRYGVLFLPGITNSGTPGATLTYAFTNSAANATPAEMLRLLSAAGWQIMSLPFSKPSAFFGEIVFNPHDDLDLEDDDELESEANDALESFYQERYDDYV